MWLLQRELFSMKSPAERASLLVLMERDSLSSEKGNVIISYNTYESMLIFGNAMIRIKGDLLSREDWP